MAARSAAAATRSEERRDSPPRPRFGLTVGVTGHRAEALGDQIGGLGARVGHCLRQLEQTARLLLAEHAQAFSSEEPRLALVSPLASGADQIAAQAALELGWELQAVLPFDHSTYAGEMAAEEGTALRRLTQASRCVLELPGDLSAPDDAYLMAGRATVAHCDLLLAVWDGLPARGKGGTAEAVDLALTRGTPVLHLPVDPGAPPTILWSAFDPVVVTGAGDRRCGRPADEASLAAVLRALLAPPAAEIERKFITRYFAERPRQLSLRLEYPLVMALAGTHRLSTRDLRARPRVEAARAEWEEYRASCVGRHGVEAPLDELQLAFEWSDKLATHFAQTYRSGHVFNFLLAALGAWIGLSGLILPSSPLAIAAGEFVVILAVVINTMTGSRRCWHQRWLDYRQVAERLRPMRSLKLLGIASPDPPGSAAEPVARRWIDWYAACLWRTIGCPAGRLRREDLQPLAQTIAERELDPQIGYNRRNAEQVAAFDRRLERLALALFLGTMIVTGSVVVGLEFFPEITARWSNWITALSAGLPALGAAIFGIRVHGDFGALAARSRSTAGLLERIAADLRAADDLPRMADLTEQAGRVMLADLGEWRLVNELHELSLA